MPACHDLPPQPFACREFPFAVDLGNGVTRTDHGTVSDFAVMRDDGKTVWLLEVVPRIAPPTDGELAVQMTKAMHVLATDATLKTKEPQHQIYEATKGVRIELVSEVVEGWVVIRAVAGVKGAANGPGSAPASTYLGPLAHVQPDQGFILDVHGLRLPARAWQFSFSPEKATVYALPDLHATLGVRALAAPCDGLDTDDPETFVQLRAPTGMTVDTAERVPGAIRVTTKDERPSIYALVCRDKQLIEVGLRGLAITPEMRAMLDQLIQPAGSAIRDDKSSSDRAQ